MPFDASYPTKVKKFLAKFVRLSKGQWANKPFALLPWQETEIIDPLFGERKGDIRRYKRLSLWVPKKNGKSSLLSALLLWFVFEEEGAECYCIANNIAQARIIFDETCAIVSNSPELSERLWVRDNIKTIQYKKKNAKIQVLSSDKRGKQGFSASFVVFDELSDSGTYQRELWSALEYSMAAREQPVLATLSTAGHDRLSLGYEQYQLAKAIKNGEKQDEAFLPVIHEAPPDSQWDSIETAKQANPSFGLTIRPDDFEEAITRAKNNPRLINEYRVLRLNQWVSVAEQWIPSTVWDKCSEDYKEESLYGKTAVIGYDGARKQDLLSWCILVKQDDKVYSVPRFVIPSLISSRKETFDNVPYRFWIEQGLIFASEGDHIDPDFIIGKLLEDCKRFRVSSIYYDPNCADLIMATLYNKHHIPCVEVAQSYSAQTAATHWFEVLCQAGQFRHNSHPVLTWNNQNTSIKNRGEEIMIDKLGGKRNDGISAIIHGLVGLLAAPVKQKLWVSY